MVREIYLSTNTAEEELVWGVSNRQLNRISINPPRDDRMIDSS